MGRLHVCVQALSSLCVCARVCVCCSCVRSTTCSRTPGSVLTHTQATATPPCSVFATLSLVFRARGWVGGPSARVRTGTVLSLCVCACVCVLQLCTLYNLLANSRLSVDTHTSNCNPTMLCFRNFELGFQGQGLGRWAVCTCAYRHCPLFVCVRVCVCVCVCVCVSRTRPAATLCMVFCSSSMPVLGRVSFGLHTMHGPCEVQEAYACAHVRCTANDSHVMHTYMYIHTHTHTHTDRRHSRPLA